MSVYLTGDTHADFRRFGNGRGWFPQQHELTKDDIVIILGDFGGIWADTPEERYWLDWLNHKNFTTVYVDGNHENYDRYNSDEFPIVDFHGGKAHKIRDSIYHLMRGYIFVFEGRTFFAFGGASSHDIEDGILEPDQPDFKRTYHRWRLQRKRFRVNHDSWWKQELPDEEELLRGRKNLEEHNYQVNYVISHCLPQSVASMVSMEGYQSDILTAYFDELIAEGLQFDHWFCGHYHVEQHIPDKFDILYKKIVRLL